MLGFCCSVCFGFNLCGGFVAGISSLQGKSAVLCRFDVREIDIGCVRLVIEQDLIDIKVEGEEESTRIAARRKHSLLSKVSGVVGSS